LTCGFTADTLDYGSTSSPDPPLSNSALSEAVKSYSSSEGLACDKHEDLDYLAHINTPNLVRDIELIRDLMGYDEMDLWGISYGAVIGTAYAAMFPDRVGRIILDGLQLNYVADS
jgi:pimeloyl-ACP methyl ester carboxylesterase